MSAASTLLLKPDSVDELRRLAKAKSTEELAHVIGVEPAALDRAVSGDASPSLGLIARIVVTFPQMSLASLCAVA